MSLLIQQNFSIRVQIKKLTIGCRNFNIIYNNPHDNNSEANTLGKILFHARFIKR